MSRLRFGEKKTVALPERLMHLNVASQTCASQYGDLWGDLKDVDQSPQLIRTKCSIATYGGLHYSSINVINVNSL